MNDPHDYISTRTAPELKWLLNERAAVLGRLSKAQGRFDAFDRSIQRYEGLLSRAISGRSSAEKDMAEKTRTLEALDISIGLVNTKVRPDAAGCVVPQDKYGCWGGLSKFLRETLRTAAPRPISGADLARLAIAHFHLSISTPQERRSFGFSVKTVLRVAIVRDEVVERLPKTQGWERTTLYRWKSQTGLDALRALSAAAEASDDSPADAP